MSGYQIDPEAPGISATDDEALAKSRGLTYYDKATGQYRRPDKDAGESENAPWLTQTQQHSDEPRDDAELFTAPNTTEVEGDGSGETLPEYDPANPERELEDADDDEPEDDEQQ